MMNESLFQPLNNEQDPKLQRESFVWQDGLYKTDLTEKRQNTATEPKTHKDRAQKEH